MFAIKPHIFAVFASALGLLLAAAATAQDRPQAKSEGSDSINKTFENPDLDPREFVDRFETESREVFAHREAIVGLLGLKPGMAVADIGAGTGLFSLLFAEQVKPDGKVYAVDIAPAFLELITTRAGEQGLAEVVATIQGNQEATNLEPGSVDLVFICDTYHHFENPERMLRSIHQALRPGGKLVVVEFDKEKASSDFIEKHVRANKEVFIEEITRAGFAPIEPGSAPELRENFIAVFQKAQTARGRQPKGLTPKAAVEARP